MSDNSEPARLDDRRPPCQCKPWAQAWRPDRPERCARCGGMFPPHTVAARRPRPGDPGVSDSGGS